MNRTYRYLVGAGLVAALFAMSSCGGDNSDLSEVVASADYLDAKDITIEGDKSSGEISVSSNTSWTAVSSASWASVGTPQGSGNAQITITTGVNPSALETRSCVVTITSADGVARKVNVTQLVAGETVGVPEADRTLAVPEAGLTYTLTLTSNTRWSITGQPDWITLSATSGQGNAELTITVAANPDEQERSATLTIAGEKGEKQQTIAVSQAAHEVVLSVSPASISADEGADTYHFTLTSNSTWTITNIPAWITPSATQGAGTQEVSLNVAAAVSEIARAATLTIQDAVYTTHTVTVEVSQVGRTVVISIEPTTLADLPARAGMHTFAVVGNAKWNITSSVQADWFSFTPDQGLGDTQESRIPVTVTLQDNTSGSARTVVLTATSESGKTATCTITQVGATPPSPTTPVASAVARYDATLSSSYTSPLAVTEAGFCYSTSAAPTVSDTVVPVAVDADSYAATIGTTLSGVLRSGTTYHVRAYARNANGIAYSPETTFTTTGDTPGDGDNPTPSL